MRERELDWKAYLECARRAAADGIVLLANEKEALPLPEGAVVSLFGRGQLTYYKSGTGSGGMVNVSHVTGIREALVQEEGISLNRELMDLYDRWNEENPPVVGEGWGNDPWSQEEMPLTREIVEAVALRSDTAVCILARTAGEDRDNRKEAGSWLLSPAEMAMLELVRSAFGRMIVLLNVGTVIDMSFVPRVRPDAVWSVWQGGMTGGLGVADVLTGRVNPGGHLTDTIAKALEDYPSDAHFGTGDADLYVEDIYVGYRYFESVAKERVQYPFGYGLTYTTFSMESGTVQVKQPEDGGLPLICFETTVTNTGKRAGRQVVQVYVRCPQGALGKPARVLADFYKSGLLAPGESETVSFRIPAGRFASFDDSGRTPYPQCWVLEKGRYDLFVGDNVRDAVCITREDAWILADDLRARPAQEACAPVRPFRRMVMRGSGEGSLSAGYEEAPLRTREISRRIEENLPPESARTESGLTLRDVMAGNCSMEAFVRQLTDDELCAIVRGKGMGSSLVTSGTAAAFGGVTRELRARGIPALCCDDGPSGMRLDCGDHAFSLPNGTLLACTFDPELNTELFSFLGLEMVKNRVDCLLGPGINIHRHPLNGRNFEYFSEDPYVTGVIASAQLKGIRKNGVTGVLKHFAANNRETGRRSLDSVVSQRALREIYLRGFEIAVRDGADAVMTSYGLLNGVHTSSLYDLTTLILRGEWGFDGIVMTDWWASFTPQKMIDDLLRGGKGTKPEMPEHGPDGVRPGDAPDEAVLTEDLMAGRITDFSSMVRAQNDLYMVVQDGEARGRRIADLPADSRDRPFPPEQAEAFGAARDPRFRGTLQDALEEGRLTRGELQRSAANICRFALKMEAMRRLLGDGCSVKVIHAPEDENVGYAGQAVFEEVPEEGLTVDLSALPCTQGSDHQMGFRMESGAYYTFSFEGSCSAGGLAQVPVAFFFTTIPIAVFVWSGTGSGTSVKRAGFLATTKNNVFRLHFSQPGVKLNRLVITKNSPGDDPRIGLLAD